MTSAQTLKDSFINEELFYLAITHRSYLNENKKSRESNERLEFLGDAILEFIVSADLFTKFPAQDEGYLTALRANLVNTKSLHATAKELGLGEILLLSKGEEEGGGRENRSILANTVEAIIGAIYLDRGLEAASEFIQENLLFDLEKRIKQPLKDAKSRLQEAVQAMRMASPRYKVVKEEGPDHNKRFEVQVEVGGETMGTGVGNSKSEAEQEAATNGLVKITSKS